MLVKELMEKWIQVVGGRREVEPRWTLELLIQEAIEGREALCSLWDIGECGLENSNGVRSLGDLNCIVDIRYNRPSVRTSKSSSTSKGREKVVHAASLYTSTISLVIAAGKDNLTADAVGIRWP